MSPARQVILWIVGALALIALAGIAPNVATWLVVLLIVGLLLTHWNDTYSKYLGGQA